ncbi:outer membrane protein [Terriglobus aquaticus]|uniref:Outer membrane protein n=1 Tax=Terriglobus aquaticus TaxID=940139 RepID=A0ABW9KMP4_9BACT|nr:outer membrane beta-barrel protein [Terriglobus aquaticus]
MLTTDAYSIQDGRPLSASLKPEADAADSHSMQGCIPRRLRTLAASGACVLSLACAGAAHAQAKPTATRAGDLQAGGGFVLAAPDYGRDMFKGYMGYATFDFKYHYGVEFNIHQINAPSPSKLYERTYELGGRYVRHYGNFHPYGKLMYGRGVFNYEYNVANLAYNIGAIGVGVDYNATRHINVRADYEYQNWFNFRGFVSQGNVTSNSASLSPQVITIGAAYHFQ